MTAAAIRRNGAYAPLGANYADDDAIATLDLAENDRAELLYIRGLAYCARDLRLEGFISDIALRAGKVLRRTPGKKGIDTVLQAANTLVDLGLWTREDKGYRIRSWSKWNKTWSEVTRKRAADRDRKGGGSDTESAGNDSGSDADSARNPNGVAPPEHVSAVQSTSEHITSRQRSAPPRPGSAVALQPPDSDTHTQAEHLVDASGPAVPTVRRRLIDRTHALLAAGTPPPAVSAALTEWHTRDRAAPGLLDDLVQDELRRANGASGRPRPSTTDTAVAQSLRRAAELRAQETA